MEKLNLIKGNLGYGFVRKAQMWHTYFNPNDPKGSHVSEWYATEEEAKKKFNELKAIYEK